MPTIESLLEETRKRLVETGSRNRLIHVNRKASRGNFLNIVNERSEDIFQILRVAKKTMRFAGKGQEEDVDANDIIFTEIEDESFDESRFTDSVLETPLTPDALQKRLLKLSKDAKTAEEEQGINILFLAMGFLKWYEDKNSTAQRESPLILIPVELQRNNRTSTYDIICREDDIVTNLSLQERLKLDFGISLPEIDDSSEWIPSEYFKQVSETISGKERWSVDADGMQLGFFSFAKLMMLRDLDPKNWNGESLLANKLINGLLADGFTPDSPLFKEEDNLDEKLSLDQILHVVDADSSQTKVIEEVRSGRNLVVQGPPGTGKSQTITNILASAAYDNKRVLFVAEKMAALEVVHNRMCKVGLKDLCLELHSKSANKKIFLQGLAETIANSKSSDTLNLDAKELKNARDELNKIANLLHLPIPDRDYTPYAILCELLSCMSKNIRPPRFEASHLESITETQEENLFDSLQNYLDITSKFGLAADNPFQGTTNLDLQPTDLQRLIDQLNEAIPKLKSWIVFQSGLEKELSPELLMTFASADSCRSVYETLQKAPNSASQFISIVHENKDVIRFKDAIAAAHSWIAFKNTMSELVAEFTWESDVQHLRQPIASGVSSFTSRLFGKYRSASNELATYLKEKVPKSPEERLKLVDAIIEGKTMKKIFDEESEFIKSKLGEEWRGERTPFSEIQSVLEWLQRAPEALTRFTIEKFKELLEYKSSTPLDIKDFTPKKAELLTTLKKVHTKLGLSDLNEDRLKGSSAVRTQEANDCND